MLKKLRIQNFRSYSDQTFEFIDGVNIIIGPNGSGKTNLLEAILMITGAKSYRVKDGETVMYQKDWARLDATTKTENRSLKLIPKEHNPADRLLEINKEVIKRITQSKKIPAVLFEPNHLLLFHGGPEARRDFLDDLLEYTLPSYQTLRKQYRRTLSQRNRLLKQQPEDIKKMIFVWNIRLSELAGQIVIHRNELIDKINKFLPKLYSDISSSNSKVVAIYESQAPIIQYSSQMLHKLEGSLQKDIERGYTTFGPHRDDLVIEIDGHAMSQNASRGETRTVLLGLKIIELYLIESVYGKKPILLLDDVFSELDNRRRQSLTVAIKGYQTFITTTDADVIPDSFSENYQTIKIG